MLNESSVSVRFLYFQYELFFFFKILDLDIPDLQLSDM